jgi:hypothetical protein
MPKPYRLLRAQMSPDAQAQAAAKARALLAADDDAQALADRVWARQAPSTRWRVVRPEETPTDTEDDTHG